MQYFTVIDIFLKVVFYLNLSERFKEGIEENKLFLEHYQTVNPNAKASQVVRGLVRGPTTNFYL